MSDSQTATSALLSEEAFRNSSEAARTAEEREAEERERVLTAFMNLHTYATGTEAYGLVAEDSDRFCTPATLAHLVRALRDYGVEFETGVSNSGGEEHRAIFSLRGRRYDIFAVPEVEIAAFKVATEAIRAAARELPALASVKPLRVQLFRAVRDTIAMWGRLPGAVLPAE